MEDTKAKFPGWRYHPETGKGEIFETPEEVPEGWVDNISDVAQPRESRRSAAPTATDDGLTEELREEVVKLEQDYTAKELAEMLEVMNETRADKIEFLSNWPKKRLATTIALHGGPAKSEPADSEGAAAESGEEV